MPSYRLPISTEFATSICRRWAFFPASRVGGDLATEVDHIVDLVEAATGSAAAYRADLTHADRELGRPVDRDAIRKIVQALVQSTSEMEYRNRTLETALKVSRQVIEDLKMDVDRIRGESLRDPLTSLPIGTTSSRRLRNQSRLLPARQSKRHFRCC
jgi:diguanylate cyclase